MPNNGEHSVDFGFNCYFLRGKKICPPKDYCFNVTRLVSDRTACVQASPLSLRGSSQHTGLFSLGIEYFCSPLLPLPPPNRLWAANSLPSGRFVVLQTSKVSANCYESLSDSLVTPHPSSPPSHCPGAPSGSLPHHPPLPLGPPASACADAAPPWGPSHAAAVLFFSSP